MEQRNSTLPVEMLPGMVSGMLGLEMPLHHHPQQHLHLHQQQQQQQQQQHQQTHQMVTQKPIKQFPYSYNTNNKGNNPQQHLVLSDEEEPGLTATDDGCGKRVSQWQRMKWTDDMVKLLIMAVFYIEDDGTGGPEGNNNEKKKQPSGGVLQKKGKWKSVSRAMMEKGFYVSPQQCEDKFNDLNKRYKRVNDILGKGTACKVVENQSLLDSMDHLSLKMKEEVRKLLNSKHLFFKEMCAYHNSGGATASGGGGGSAGAHQSSEVYQQQRCFHSSEITGVVANSSRMETQGLRMGKGLSREGGEEEEENGENEDDDDDEDEDDDDGEEVEMEDEDENDEKLSSKKRRRGILFSPWMKQARSEVMNVIQDGTKNSWEKRQWMRSKSLQLEEQRVSYEWQAFELEKQRLKWVRFSDKKEKEMETMKLNNQRMKLENERMILLLRQKELELIDLHHHHQQQQQQHSSNKRADPSSITG